MERPPPPPRLPMSSPPQQALVQVAEIPGRGRSLVASRAIKPGEILLSDAPLLLYPATPSSSSCCCSHCFRSLHPDALHCPSCGPHALFCSPLCLSAAAASSSHPSWLCSAVARLRSLPLPLHSPDLLPQAHFLLAAHSLPPSDFLLLLSLSAPDDAADTVSEAPALASLLSSLSLPPPPSGFVLADVGLTAALLARDRRNAFGLMEPSRDGDAGQRRVRAYAIYPKASFFNHDCLPNACRFEYLDDREDSGGSRRNTEMVVRAIHDIPEGREVCLSYFPVNWGFEERQQRLREEYGFECHCDRCEVEKNWKDDDEDDGVAQAMEEEEGDNGDGEMDGMEEENGEEDFPHAYFFVRYLCDQENCGGTLAPLPPSPRGTHSDVMECSVCGRLRKEEDIGRDNCEDADGVMLDE